MLIKNRQFALKKLNKHQFLEHLKQSKLKKHFMLTHCTAKNTKTESENNLLKN